MVTVASEVTVPSALMLMPMSPLPTASGTIDIGAELRPRPPGSGCGACLVHQTMPATTSRTTIDVRTKRRPDRPLAVCVEPSEGTSSKFLIGWFIDLPSDRKCERRFSPFVAGTGSGVRPRPYLNARLRVVALTIGKNCTFGSDRDREATIKSRLSRSDGSKTRAG